jgi:hypothetical protein
VTNSPLPAENVDLVVTRFPAAEVRHHLCSFVIISSRKWKICHKFSFQIAGFPCKIVTICHVARNWLVQKLWLGANAES